MSPCAAPAVPTISIDFVSSDSAMDPVPELTHSSDDSDDDEEEESHRSRHLVPPPILSPIRGAHYARQVEDKKGLDVARFEQLLQVSRNKVSTGKKPVELRKEVTLKAHKNKQLERRALFLSKVGALPSPTAACTPVTPPESPAVFHFSLPSPGLMSPIALFEALEREGTEGAKRPTWVEEVDFRVTTAKDTGLCSQPKSSVYQGLKPPRAARSKAAAAPLPSLDQITARLTQNKGAANAPTPIVTPAPRAPIPLPAFLAPRQRPRAGSVPAPPENRAIKGRDMVEKLRRRTSPPALPSPRQQHPVLRLPGGF
ncbi:hypothetical protein BOTBODRAFT_170257 [Botryobasidium botryosum FD-172 SS1]|uniref:Uncharacterized protein n=1 Tax=Botryobasidium botryosum (strain FD-172 SS1) TaxID=930990 RepID=A0A067MZZ1_BOTB1|nr:hypothetical protein BOTBODRAFT_170257 [Botryobasidium botryosum FD-172 SS1]